MRRFSLLLIVQQLALLTTLPVFGANEKGLIGVLFNEWDFQRPDKIETAAQVNFDTGTQHKSYSRFLLGRIRIPTAKEITFHAEADDGVTLLIDGHEIIRGWHHPQRQGRFTAVEGTVLPMELRYFQNGGASFLRLYWWWEGHGRELIPATAFTHTEADVRRARAIASGAGKVTVPALASDSHNAATAVPQKWSPGPWLLLDERNILAVDHLRRVLGRPVRHGEPVVDGAVDGNFQPYVSVMKDPISGRWRMWYNVPRTPGDGSQSRLAHIESEDGVHWRRPHRVLATAPIQFGASVIDEGPGFSDPAKRFKGAWFKDDGLQVSTSPDGITWTPLAPGPLLRHSHDINAIDWDPIRRRYMAFVSFGAKLDPTWPTVRRIPHMSTSDDLVHWRQPWAIIAPDPASPREQGDTEFYCMAGVIARGSLLIGMAKVLRDDLNAEVGLSPADFGDRRPHAGIGYTVLAWSADGEHWRRDTEPFLDRNQKPGTWDRAHAWADEQVLHGDEVFLYYGGYRLGHKAERFTTRQIGLARLKLDRYAGYAATGEYPGTLCTAARPWNGGALTVNADIRGELRVALCEPSGKFLPGFSFAECEPVRGDQVAHPVVWKKANPASLRNRRVQMAFQVRDGTVFAFSVRTSPMP
jgi:hypothetical protein